jgi:hypothetical protein
MTVQKLAKVNKKFVQRYRGEDYLAESIVIAGKPKFALVKDKLISIVDNIGEYYPTIGLSRPYTFNSEKEFDSFIVKAKAETLDTLIEKVSNQWKKYSHADEFENALCAADTIFTYYQDILGMTHYLFFVGSPDSGKSNKLCLFNVLAYRNFMSSDTTAANIYRHLGSVQEGQGTICEDEADNLDEDGDRMRVYKMGYTKGFRVPRNDKEANGELNQNGYFTYGWKAFAAERQPDSTTAKGFASRVIPIGCLTGLPKYDISEILSPADDDLFVRLHDQLFEVRNLLFSYSLLHCFDKIQNINLNITNREKQLFKPLIRLFQGTETQGYLFKIASHFVNERRKQNVDSLLAFLYKILNDMVKEDNQEIGSGLIWDTIKVSLDGSDIPNKPMSYESTEYGTLSQKVIIQMIKDNFKSTSPTRTEKQRSLKFSRTVLNQLSDKYEVNLELQVVEEMTDETDETDAGGIQDQIEGTDLPSSCKYSNNMSHPSAVPHFERVLEGLEAPRPIPLLPCHMFRSYKSDSYKIMEIIN